MIYMRTTEIVERRLEVTPETAKACAVRIGGRVAPVAMPAREAKALLAMIGRKPAPCIWRLLGVDA